jgi:hypothetical protein
LTIDTSNDKEGLSVTAEILNYIRAARPSFSPLTRYKASSVLMSLWACYSVWFSLRRLVAKSPLPKRVFGKSRKTR